MRRLLEMVGEILRAEREKKGLTIKDVEAGTSIRALYIQSIEENKYDVIPGEVYLKGFIKTYANFLNLDGMDMVDQYRQEKTPPTIVAEEVADNVVQTNKVDLRNEHKTDIDVMNKKKIAIGAYIVVLLSGCGYWMFSPDTKDDAANVKEQMAATTTQAVKENPSTTPVAVPQAKPVAISLKFEGSCWTEVKVDNKNIYEGIPNTGEVLTWDANQDIVVKLGNAGVVDVTHNGKAIGKLGGVGDVIEKKFNKGQVN